MAQAFLTSTAPATASAHAKAALKLKRAKSGGIGLKGSRNTSCAFARVKMRNSCCAILSIRDGTDPTARGALDLQQAFMKFIGESGIEDMVFPFAIDLQILSGQSLFLKADAF